MADDEHGDVQAAIDYAERQPRSIPVGDTEDLMLVVVPDQSSVERIDLRDTWANPRRATGVIVTEDVQSFIGAVTVQRETSTAIYAHSDGTMTAVINEHGAEPGWRDYRVNLVRPQALAFRQWLAVNDKPQTQYELANFIEDHLGQIVSPAGAELLEIAQTFKASRRLSFRSQNILRNGQVQVSYIEELEGGGGDQSGGPEARIAIPEEIMVLLRPYRDEEPAGLKARLRWGLREKVVSFTIRFPELDDWLDAIHDKAIIEVAEALPDVAIYRGHE